MNRNLHLQALAAATSLVLAGSAAAANRVELSKLDVKSINSQYSASIAATGEPRMNHSRHELLLKVEQDSFLVMQSSNKDHGAVNRRYVQTFRGLPIFNENLVVSEDAQGNVKALFGRKVDGLAREIASTTPRLSQAQALVAAKRAAVGHRTVVGNEKAELQIYIDDSGTAYLAYAVDFVADTSKGDSLSRPKVIVDANNGRVLLQYENLQTANGTGPGGNQKTGQYEYGSNGLGFLDVTQVGTTCTMESTPISRRSMPKLHGRVGPSFVRLHQGPHSYNCPRNTVQDSQRRLLAAQRRALLWQRRVQHVPGEWGGANPLPGKLMSARALRHTTMKMPRGTVPAWSSATARPRSTRWSAWT